MFGVGELIFFTGTAPSSAPLWPARPFGVPGSSLHASLRGQGHPSASACSWQPLLCVAAVPSCWPRAGGELNFFTGTAPCSAPLWPARLFRVPGSRLGPADGGLCCLGQPSPGPGHVRGGRARSLHQNSPLQCAPWPARLLRGSGFGAALIWAPSARPAPAEARRAARASAAERRRGDGLGQAIAHLTGLVHRGVHMAVP